MMCPFCAVCETQATEISRQYFEQVVRPFIAASSLFFAEYTKLANEAAGNKLNEDIEKLRLSPSQEKSESIPQLESGSALSSCANVHCVIEDVKYLGDMSKSKKGVWALLCRESATKIRFRAALHESLVKMMVSENGRNRADMTSLIGQVVIIDDYNVKMHDRDAVLTSNSKEVTDGVVHIQKMRIIRNDSGIMSSPKIPDSPSCPKSYVQAEEMSLDSDLNDIDYLQETEPRSEGVSPVTDTLKHVSSTSDVDEREGDLEDWMFSPSGDPSQVPQSLDDKSRNQDSALLGDEFASVGKASSGILRVKRSVIPFPGPRMEKKAKTGANIICLDVSPLRITTARKDARLGMQRKKPSQPYYEVVRNRSDREELQGAECAVCREWHKDLTQFMARGEGLVCKHHLQDQSRHRYKNVPVGTPDGYWDVNFPPTQKPR